MAELIRYMQFTKNTDESSARYWDDLADLYQKETRISTDDFHYGPLLPGDSILGLLPPVPQRSCLEIGCGAGQNSIFLAKQGAQLEQAKASVSYQGKTTFIKTLMRPRQ